MTIFAQIAYLLEVYTQGLRPCLQATETIVLSTEADNQPD